MKYQGVCIAVRDVKLAQKFYQDLFGLEVFQDYGINVSFGGLSLQQDFNQMLNFPKEKMLNEPHNMELYFEEDDFDSFIAKLSQRNDIRYMGDGVKEAGWGQRSIHFYDLDGHIIEVGENMKMVVKRFLDSGMVDDTTYQGKELVVQSSNEELAEQMNMVVSDGHYPAAANEALLD